MNETEQKKMLSLLGFAARARKAVTGADQVTEEVRRRDRAPEDEPKRKNSGIVLIARDASANTVKRLENACAYHGIRCERTNASMAELSHILGKSADVATVGLFDKSFAKAVEALFDDGMEKAKKVPEEGAAINAERAERRKKP